MNISVLTEEDLQAFKHSMIEEFEMVLKKHIEKVNKEPELVLLKSHQVQRMLAISPGTLQNMRTNGTLPFSKVGGITYYIKDDILKIIQDNKRND
ncbi:helix-turn-helix domain-containing protein [Brumimicrobium sp.]|uniref:helix-turn-helix domain-containing protein n=1 Tax=Brumimicrobium sp. TaxID=2029867 RepID=UPI002625552E|nr:helix-turn-helix domain-containing protein [uncultured Brumimicrobium sp.]